MSDTIPPRPNRHRSWAEPFKIKVVELLKMTTRAERERAIAALLNRSFHNSITVKASLKDGCLRVMLESAQVLEQDTSVTIIRQGMMRLQPASIHSVKVDGRQIGKNIPVWSEEFRLQPALQNAHKQLPNLKQLAKQGDLEAIASLLNRAVEHKRMTAKVSLNDGCLKVILESERVPEQDVAVVLVDRELVKLHLPLIKQIEISGYKVGEILPAWVQNFQPGSQVNVPISHPLKPATIQPKHRQYSDHKSRFLAFGSSLPTQSINPEGWQSLAAGFFLAILLSLSSKLTFFFSYFIILVHELGHTCTGWIFGYPSIPAFNFINGGGITLQQERVTLMIVLIYLVISSLFYFYRNNRLTWQFLATSTAIYSLCAFTDIHKILNLSMGHGFELLFAGIFLYRAISGYGCRYSIERPLYGMLAFFTVFYDVRFAWQLIFDPSVRATYEEGIGGVLDNDFVLLAGEYFRVDLSVVVALFLALCALTPLLTFLCFRYKNVWTDMRIKLFSREV